MLKRLPTVIGYDVKLGAVVTLDGDRLGHWVCGAPVTYPTEVETGRSVSWIVESERKLYDLIQGSFIAYVTACARVGLVA